MTAGLHRLNVILDGLDECDDSTDVLLAVKELLTGAPNVHVAAFSRDVPSIRTHAAYGARIEIDATNNRSDMDYYVQKSIAKLILDDSTLESEITNTIKRKADGMFLWTVCVMDNLRSAMNPREALETLHLLPSGIDAYYNLALDKLSQQHLHRRRLGETVLRWMCCLARPLSWPEMRSCLGLAHEKTQVASQHYPFQSVVLDICAPFAKLDAITNTLRLSHHSARESLLQKFRTSDMSQSHVDEAETHENLAEVCLRQLLSNDRESAFAQYANMFWLDHVLQANCSSSLQGMVVTLVGDSEVMDQWFLDRIRWDGQRGFSTSKILGSQPVLNTWLQSSAEKMQVQQIDWIKPLVYTFLQLDENVMSDEHGYQALHLSHLEKLMIMRDLARVLTQSKRLDEGITWFEAALCRRRELREPQVAYCWLLSALGNLYDQRNEIRRSLDLYTDVLAIQEAELDQQSLETVWTINELGRVYRPLGVCDKAEEHHRRALKSLLETLSEDHLEVIWTMNTLARACRKSGKLTLAGQERALGATHSHPLWTRGDVGKCYFALEYVREAEEFHRASLIGRESILGTAHIDTLWSMAKLGQVLGTCSQYDEAVDLLQGALDGQR
jgi:tetratricopeptide (TPR) repeat protein